MIKHYNIKISGRVQGVGFRYHTRMMAVELHIKGFVRNIGEDSVYIEAEGEEDLLNEFLNWCRQGPSWAYVENLKFSESQVEDFTNFEIRR